MPATSSATCVTSPIVCGVLGVERFAGEHRRGDLARRDLAQDRHRDHRRGHADPHLGEGERGGRRDDAEITRCHQGRSRRRGRCRRWLRSSGHGPVHQPFQDGDHRPRVGGRVRIGTLLEVGAGAEGRAFVPEHDHPRRLAHLEALVQLLQQLTRQRVAVVGRVERDRSDPAATSTLTSSAMLADRILPAQLAQEGGSTSSRSRVRFIGGRAFTMSHR